MYLSIIFIICALAVNANRQQAKYTYFEEDVRHGLHYGIWSNTNQMNGQFTVRCFEVDSAQAKQRSPVLKSK